MINPWQWNALCQTIWNTAQAFIEVEGQMEEGAG